MRRRRSRARWVARALAALALALVVAFFFATRTDRGATLVVEEVLRRLPIKGEITAESSRADRLLEGVRLYGVAVRDQDGLLFLLADSVRLRYNWRTLVSGDVVFDTVEMWRPSVMITRYAGEREFNVERLFISEAEAQDTARAPLKNVAFYGVSIHGGELRVLYPKPAGAGPRFVTVPAPRGDSALIRHTFAGIDARISSAILQTPDSVGQRVVVDSLAFLGEVLEEPVRVRDVAGTVRYVAGRMDASLDRMVLDHSEAKGRVFVELAEGREPLHYGFDLETPGLELEDIAWLDPRITEGRAIGGVSLDANGEEFHFRFRTLRVASRESRVQLDGEVALDGDGVRFQGLDVRAAPLALARLEPWLAEPLPLRGSVEGNTDLDGTLGSLAARGRVTLRRPGPDQGPITADFNGTLHMGDEPGSGIGFTDLRATLDPFDFGVLGEFAEGVKITGPGRVVITATGRTTDAVEFRTEIHHRPVGLPPSDVTAQGTVRRRGQVWVLDVGADAQPLSLTALARYYPQLPLTGNVTGTVHAGGLLSDLTLETDLVSEAGRLAVTAHFDAEHPGQRYAVAGEVTQFALSKLAPSLPQPTTITGYLSLEGRGTDPRTLTLDATARLRPSRVGGLFVDNATLALRARGGVLHVDTLQAVAGGIAVQGQGTLALEPGGLAGTMTVEFQSDSLARLRPLVLGDVVIARDTLSELDRELLRAEGVDPDTLRTRADVELSGRLRGRATLTGSVRDFAAEGSATFESARYGRSVVRGATVTFAGSGLPSLNGRLAGTIDADSMQVAGRAFSGAHLEVEYAQPRGRLAVQLRRRDAEDYTARAAFELHEKEGRLDLEELALRFDSLTWALERPSVLAWNEQGLRIQNLVLSSPQEPLRIEADGLIPRQGPADLTVRIQGLRLERIASLLQREDLGLEGMVAFYGHVGGTAAAPLITGTLDATDLDFQTFSLTRFEGRLDYEDRTLGLDVGAWQDARRVLTATGQVPVDLAFGGVERRVPLDRQMDLAVVADSMPAALALGYFDVLSDVEGSISGQFHIGGSIQDPNPSGVMTMNDAAWTLVDLGVRHQAIRGNLQLRPDGVVEVALTGRSGGVIITSGRITLHPLTNPTFDLVIAALDFQAVARADVEGTISGAVTLTGTYDRPVVTSREGYPVRIESGVIYVEEFQRTISIVDLADPAFFAVVDTTVVNPRPLLGATANPFLRNMRVDVDLTAERNSWLRGEDINVEMGGDLQVLYDRQRGDLVMLGALQAIRGTYTILGRRFDVQTGTVNFVGTPGINPELNILASTRVRQRGVGGADNGDLNVQASVTGTLIEPRVALSSDNGAIAQSDLISYLVFGVPSYQLASGQRGALNGAAGGFVGSALGGVTSFVQGTLASQLSSLVAREWGFLDYFAISQGDQLSLSASENFGVAASLASTTLEVGFYLEQNVFLTLLLRPLASSQAGVRVDRFGGARIDWQLSEKWTLQAFYEDQAIRLPTLAIGQDQFKSRKVPGLFLFREWGYGGPRGAPPAPPLAAPQMGALMGASGASPIGIRWRRIRPAR
ncbi:MAG: translocation/assembly module TamB [Gemmatimonadetes bacterium]|nr:translocation/assembly module TamB [Gemmatimonadota bacterium]